MLRRICLLSVAALALWPLTGIAQSSGYVLVPNWAKLPPGMYFGSKNGQPKSADTTRKAKARPQGMDKVVTSQEDPDEGLGVSGLAIDAQDHIYAFNRGKKPVMVFDRDGNLLYSGGDQEMNGKTIKFSGLHSGGVDWDGNVYVVDNAQARVVKLSPKLDKFLLQIGTTGEPGVGPNHMDRPSGVVILRNGNIVVTDGYGNNRVAMWDKNGKFIKQVGKGAGGPKEPGKGIAEFELPHTMAVDANENIFVVDRENYRIQVFDKDLNYIRQFSNPDWNPWGIAISRKGTEGIGFVADHTSEQVLKISLADGKILDRWGKPGRGPGEFDWVHGVVVDSLGAVYVVDSYGQHFQKFEPAAKPTAAR